MEKLYMLEVLISEVVFEELPVPLKKDIIINVTCPNIGSLEIRTNVMGALENLEAKERSAKRKDFNIGCGRSLLFPKDSRRMKDVVKNDNLELSVYTTLEMDPVGSVHIPWSSYFVELVESSMETSGYLTPVVVENEYELLKNGKHTVRVNMTISLSFLGRAVYTNIQKMTVKDDSGAPGGLPDSYLFKSADNATIFKCERHGPGSDHDVMPIAAIYNLTAQQAAPGGLERPMKKATKSTETLLAFNSMASTTSMRGSAFFGMSTVDMGSMAQRVMGDFSTATLLPAINRGNNYLDLTNLKMDMSTFSMLASAMGMHVYQDSTSGGQFQGGEGEDGGYHPMFIDYKSLTVAEIEARLCKHPDCPAAKKFKEFGIGPLAKNIRGLGGLYKDVEAPCAYGLSHCNGTIDDYGPLGRFKRPKKAEEPFVPQSDCKCARKSSSIVTTKSAGSNTSTRNKGKTACYSHCPINPMKMSKKPLRLKGGAPVAGCETMPNPFTLCQDLMDEFNKVLKDYKEALGPCGQATCPFALSVIGDQCYEVCNSSDPEYQKQVCDLTNEKKSLEEKDEFTGCGVPYCPYKRAAISPAEKEYSKYKNMPGCGYTNCPFIKAKLGMEPDEDTHLPPFKDYMKQETYKYTDKLPPIHWDCPEPLPKGDCKNPDCPFVKRDALIKKYFPEPCCPCGNPACPYVCAPCAFPGCPFSVAEPCPPVCPYTEPPPKELKCTPSVCPFVRATEERCQNPLCPYRIYEEKMAECAEWERQQALLAEQEEEEQEEDEPCKPCGRGKSTRARCSQNKDLGEDGSTSKLQTQTLSKTSGTNFSSLPEKTEEPCILSAAAEKGKPCLPDTCKEGVCKVCKSQTITKSKLETKITSKANMRNGASFIKGKGSTSVKDVGTGIGPSVATSTAPPKQQIDKPSVAYQKQKPQKAKQPSPSNKVQMGPLGPITIKGRCRKLPFRFDRSSYKPCQKIGHRECVLPKFLVPKCMGWLWNIHEDICGLRPRRGWKPGAVSKMLAFRMDYFNALREKRPFGVKPKEGVLVTKPSQPTVQINKKAGVVNVTMLPVKEPAEVQKAGDGKPYLDVSPIQFKITKNNPQEELKYCYCGEPISESDSELDIEFSPPAALRNPRLMHKNTWSEEEQQYNIDDVPLPEKPKKEKGKAKGKGKGKGKKGKGKKGGKKKK